MFLLVLPVEMGCLSRTALLAYMQQLACLNSTPARRTVAKSEPLVETVIYSYMKKVKIQYIVSEYITSLWVINDALSENMIARKRMRQQQT